MADTLSKGGLMKLLGAILVLSVLIMLAVNIKDIVKRNRMKEAKRNMMNHCASDADFKIIEGK